MRLYSSNCVRYDTDNGKRRLGKFVNFLDLILKAFELALFYIYKNKNKKQKRKPIKKRQER
jgi:hypothetical protein